MNEREIKYLRNPLDPTIELTPNGFVPLDTLMTTDPEFNKFERLPPFKGTFPDKVREAPFDDASGVTDPEEIKDIKNITKYIKYLERLDVSSALPQNEFLDFIESDSTYKRFLDNEAYKRFLSSSSYQTYLAEDGAIYFDKDSHKQFMKYLIVLNKIEHSAFLWYQDSPEYLKDKEKVDFDNDYTAIGEYTASAQYILYLEQLTDYNELLACLPVILNITGVSEIGWEAM